MFEVGRATLQIKEEDIKFSKVRVGPSHIYIRAYHSDTQTESSFIECTVRGEERAKYAAVCNIINILEDKGHRVIII